MADLRLRVRLPETVRSDLPVFIHPVLTAKPGVYDIWMNRYGAVAVILDGGEHLGVKPAEFSWLCPVEGCEAGCEMLFRHDGQGARPARFVCDAEHNTPAPTDIYDGAHWISDAAREPKEPCARFPKVRIERWDPSRVTGTALTKVIPWSHPENVGERRGPPGTRAGGRRWVVRHLYLLGWTAQRMEGMHLHTAFCVGSAFAYSEAEAYESAMRYAQKEFPAAAGWSDHGATVGMLPDDQLRAACALLSPAALRAGEEAAP